MSKRDRQTDRDEQTDRHRHTERDRHRHRDRQTEPLDISSHLVKQTGWGWGDGC